MPLKKKDKPKDKPPKKAGLQWDEANLLDNEDQKVPRTKITEPKTPYHTLSKEDQDLLTADPDALAAAISASAYARRDLMDPEGAVDREAEALARKEEFERKRKAHYQEFVVAKRKLSGEEDKAADDDQDSDSDASSSRPFASGKSPKSKAEVIIESESLSPKPLSSSSSKPADS